MASQEDEKMELDRLPDEMLLEIFKQVDGKTLKNSSLVCKKWNNLIGQSKATMKKLPFKCNCERLLDENSQLAQFSRNLNRQYHSFHIEGNIFWWSNEQTQLLEKIGKEARYLLMEGTGKCFEIDAKSLMNILESLPKLESIEMHHCCFVFCADCLDVSPAKLPQLKSVVLHKSNMIKFFELFSMAQLTSLKINAPVSNDPYLATFLCTQKMIQELALRDLSLVEIFRTMELEKVKEINFPLKKLSLRKMAGDFGTDVEEKFIAFLNNFAGTLEELELCGQFPDSIYEMIFKKFLKLKVLKVDMTTAPKENSFYHNLRPNRSVRKLIILSCYELNAKSFEGFIGNLPNIQTLIVEYGVVRKDLLVFISNNLVKLETLHMITIDGSMTENICISSVKALKVLFLLTLDPQDWENIVKAFPNIEEFTVEKVYDPASLTVLMFSIFTLGWINLRHLMLGAGFVADEQNLIQLLRNCTNFKSLQIHETAFQNETSKANMLKDFNKNGLSFIISSGKIPSFCTFNSFWNNNKR